MNRHVHKSAMLAGLLLIAPPALCKKFAGHHCPDDCSQHIAGYLWAEGRKLDSPDDCVGNSPSFIEGCQTYALGESFEVEDEGDEGTAAVEN